MTNRRKFLKNTFIAGSSLMLSSVSLPAFTSKLKSKLELTVLATKWGFNDDYDAFCKKAKADGYNGIDVWVPQKKDIPSLLKAVKKHHMKYSLLVGSWIGNDFKAHFKEFKNDIERAISLKPLSINCHTGRDYYTYDQCKAFFEYTIRRSAESGIPILHETHRGRILFAAHITEKFLNEFPDLRLTLDISHWCNVHSSLLDDQQEAVNKALQRTDHVHGRIGHAQSPQVTDPRDPSWEKAFNAHIAWWDRVVEIKRKTTGQLILTPEFGTAASGYMATVPYTKQPLANQWEINKYIMDFWRSRYTPS